VKPPPFEYHDPRSLDEALALLAEHGEDAKPLAGGQSLVPLLNFRLAEPARLVDLNRIGELAYLHRREGSLHIGAMCRQATLERSPLAAQHWPLLGEAISHLAHAQIRNRGTVGGSAAHADPAAELPVAFAVLEARFKARSATGQRTLSAEQFFRTHLTTALEPDELLTEVELPPQPAAAGHAFEEFSRRHGDFALGGAACLLTLANGAVAQARIGLLAAADTPLRAAQAERALVGAELDEQSIAAAARLAVEGLEPTGDIHGGSDYRRQLIEAMVRRALQRAGERARGEQA
jgi:carbon-monoxide dehydrogenase medium subunit/6-hydroxypseudooxynicotine dehydrogenase subunit alpha